MRRLILALVALATGLVLVGCGSDNDNSKKSEPCPSGYTSITVAGEDACVPASQADRQLPTEVATTAQP